MAFVICFGPRKNPICVPIPVLIEALKLTIPIPDPPPEFVLIDKVTPERLNEMRVLATIEALASSMKQNVGRPFVTLVEQEMAAFQNELGSDFSVGRSPK